MLLFVLAFSLYYERIMYAEEQFLTRKFPDRHRSWSRDIPAFFSEVQRLEEAGRGVLPLESSSTGKKNGLVAIFLIFTFFHLAELFVEERLAVDYVLLGLTAASVLLYLALRCLKKSRLCDYR